MTSTRQRKRRQQGPAETGGNGQGRPETWRHPFRPLVALGLCTLVLIAYSNSFSAGFALDNKQLILNDPRLRAASSENFELIVNHSYWWPYGESGLYRPLTTLSYLFNYAILGNGDRPAGYHWVNVGLHAINVLLVYTLLRRLTGHEWVPIAAAATWAVLPLSTEAVTNIVGRADLLAASSVLAGTLLYLKIREAPAPTRLKWLMALAAVTAAGVFSKESAVAIALVILAYELVWWDRRHSVGWLLRASVFVGAPILWMLWQRWSVLGASAVAEFPFEDNPIVEADVGTGLLTAVTVMARYLWLLVWPARLSVDYSYGQIPLARGGVEDWLAFAAVAAIAGIVIAFRKRQEAIFFWAAFAFATFLPVSNLLFPTGTIMAERLMYLPSVGLVGAAVTALAALSRNRTQFLTAVVVIALAVAAFTARTWRRNQDWKDDVTLWSAAVEVSPKSAKAHLALAEALWEPTFANLDRAIDEAERSVSLLAPLPDALSSFKSYRQAAAYHLDKATVLKRREPAPAGELAQVYERARTLLERSLSIIDASTAHAGGDGRVARADVHALLAATYIGREDLGRAGDEARIAQELDPLNLLSHQLGASALFARGQRDDAAIALMVGSLLTGNDGLRRDLIGLYRNGLDAEGCAVTDSAAGPVLNPRCPIVRRHLCAASTRAIPVNQKLGRADEVNRLTKAAIDLGCSPTA